MRHNFVAVAIALSFLTPAVASGKQAAGTAGAPRAQAAPSISILRPLHDEVYFDHPIFVQVKVSNFTLLESGAKPASQTALSGHINYQLDDFPVLTTTETQVMFGKNLGFGYLPVGRHLLTVSLRDQNDRPLNPPVEASVHLMTGHPAMPDSSNGASGNPVQEVLDHLSQAQKALQRIQSGTHGYMPDPRFKNNGRVTPPGRDSAEMKGAG